MPGTSQPPPASSSGPGGDARGPVTVRPARPADAPTIARAHVRAWQAAYRDGLMPDDYLDAMDPDRWAAGWTRLLAEPSPGVEVAVAVVDDVVRGFVTSGPEREPEAGADATTGEVYALNLDPDVWGRGAGHALLTHAEARLAGAGSPGAVLWVHPGNVRARRFYGAHGWAPDAGPERTEEVNGVLVPEVRYRKRLDAP